MDLDLGFYGFRDYQNKGVLEFWNLEILDFRDLWMRALGIEGLMDLEI